MPTSTGSPLNLQKPISSEVVDLTVINSNYDTINSKALSTDATIASVQGSITTLNTTVGASGTVQNAVKATNVAGGLVKQIPIQSAVNATTFIAAPSAAGKLLSSSATAPYAVWADPIPYRLQAGSGTGTGSITVTFGVPFDTGVIPVVSCVASANTTPTIITVNAVSNTGFTIKIWDQQATTPFQFIAATTSRTVFWNAIQVSP